ncbi:calcium-binding protein [Streptomyces sp. 6N223]|uniref:calcium-binding protein n=1 Tax=Streptomyces sp. 6N223 TaxID=3457412 RepID=UPI003FD3C50E
MPTSRTTITASTAVTAGALALLASGLAATPANAQTMAMVSADWENQSIMYMAGEGQVNDLYITAMAVGEDVREIGFNDEAAIQPGDHCRYLDPEDDTFVVCELPTDSTLPDDIHAFLADGDDSIFTSDPGVAAVHGGPGNDELHAHTADMVMGEDGDDMIMGDAVLDGGDGMDHLMGDASAEELYGGRGDDMIEAYDGADTIYANSGDDEVRAGRGADLVSGGPDDDTLYGNSGNDIILGGPGTDALSGGPGEDEVTQ